MDAVVYDGQCAELCGRNHANMLARVIGLSPQDFDAWVNRKAQEIKTAQTDVAKQHAELQKQQSEQGQTP
jgi:cytochrome c oxidase subunit 2